MKLITQADYPKTLRIKGVTYEVRFPKRMPGSNLEGYCCVERKILYINSRLTAAQQFSVFIHEVLHALQYEHSIDITHAAVYGLETALTDLLLVNF